MSRASASVRPSGSSTSPGTARGLLVLLLTAVPVVVALVGFRPARVALRLPLLRAWDTAGVQAPAALDALGCALVVVPSLLAAAAILAWSRIGPAVRTGLLALVAVLGYLAMLMGGTTIPTTAEAVGGYGSAYLSRGTTHTTAALITMPIVLFVLHRVGAGLHRTVSRPVHVTVAVLVLLGAAAVSAATARQPADVNLPPEVSDRDGTVLARTATSAQRGCADVMANESLLGGCLRTVRTDYASRDGDTRVRVTAVQFVDVSSAMDVQLWLPPGSGAQGVAGDVVTDIGHAGPWILLGTAHHRDGRRIAQEDRIRLRTALSGTFNGISGAATTRARDRGPVVTP